MGAGAIGHAEWTGVPLRRVLEESGLRPDAVEVLFEGCDRGSEPDHPEPMHFARSLPLDKVLNNDTLLVTPHERRAARAPVAVFRCACSCPAGTASLR